MNTIHKNITVIDESSIAEAFRNVQNIVVGMDFDERHMSPYRMIGMSVDSLSSMFPPSEPLSMKERKKRYNDALRKKFNRGKKW